MKILLVEDNKSISKGLVYSFKQDGYDSVVCETMSDTLSLSSFDFDIIILDITLPDGNGFDLYKNLRTITDSPVIFLTALDDEDNIVNGLELGAEDYITKPFSIRELMARIKRISMRNKLSDTLTVSDITIDFDSSTVQKGNNPVELTALEFRIFSLLMQNKDKTVSREMILEKIWDIAGNYVNDNTLTVYIKRIRQKLDTDIIHTVKGLGYRVETK